MENSFAKFQDKLNQALRPDSTTLSYFVLAEENSYVFRKIHKKFSDYNDDYLVLLVRETLRYLQLSVYKESSLFFPGNMALDDIWHCFILESDFYFRLCEFIGSEGIITHSGITYEDYQLELSPEELHEEHLSWLVSYVQNFGPIDKEAAEVLILVKDMVEYLSSDLNSLNELAITLLKVSGLSKKDPVAWEDLISQMKKDIFRLDHSPKAIEQAIRDVLHNENKGSNLYLSNGKLRDLFRVSGCLGFTMWQNLSAFERLFHSPNWQSKNKMVWDQVSSSNALLGLGVTHLMKEDCPLVGIEKEGTFEVSGEIPWISGIGLFQYFLIGFRIDNHNYIVHIESEKLLNEKNIKKNTLDLVAFHGTNSVRLKIDRLEIPKSSLVVKFKLGEKSQNYLTKYVFPETGMARRALEEVNSINPNNDDIILLDKALSELESKAEKAIEESNYGDFFDLYVKRDSLINNCIRTLALYEGGKAMTTEGLSGLLNKQSLLLDIVIQPAKVKQLKVEGFVK